MNMGLELMAGNLNMGFENILLLVVTVGCLVFYAKDYRLGLMLHLLGFAGLFMWFYEAELNYAPALVAFFTVLIIMCFVLYGQSRYNNPAGVA